MTIDLFKRKLLYKFYKKIPFHEIVPADIDIDVVMPVIRKDIKILPLCLQGIRRCIPHRIDNIYIVAPDDFEIKSFCKNNNLIYVDESSVLGYAPERLNLGVSNPDGRITDRSGWLFQQLIKLSGKIGTRQHYFCIDADHILLQSHTLISSKNKFVFYLSPEFHKPYYVNIEKLIKKDIANKSVFSYVAHKMFFDKNVINKLHAEIEQNNGMRWDKAILSMYDRTQVSGFSEFELYGNYIDLKHKHLRPWLHRQLEYDRVDSYENLVDLYGIKNMSITFPKYI